MLLLMPVPFILLLRMLLQCFILIFVASYSKDEDDACWNYRFFSRGGWKQKVAMLFQAPYLANKRISNEDKTDQCCIHYDTE